MIHTKVALRRAQRSKTLIEEVFSLQCRHLFQNVYFFHKVTLALITYENIYNNLKTEARYISENLIENLEEKNKQQEQIFFRRQMFGKQCSLSFITCYKYLNWYQCFGRLGKTTENNSWSTVRDTQRVGIFKENDIRIINYLSIMVYHDKFSQHIILLL